VTRRTAAGLVALGAVVGGAMVLLPLLHGQPLLGFTADDAYITFRYSDNLAFGHGPVWNHVGARADGYTSPLWMTLVAATDLLGIGNEAASKALSLAAALGLAALLAFAGGRRAPLVRAIAIGALAASPAFMAITVQGFETTTAAFLGACTLLALVAALQRPRRRELLQLAVAAMLAVFARPDLLPFVVVCFAGLGAWLARARDWVALRTAALWLSVGFVVPGVVWAVWHRAYYGYPLPNTSYVKRSDELVNDRSLEYVKGFLSEFGGPLLLALLAVLVLVTAGRRRGGERRTPVVWAAYTALIGAAAFLLAGLKFDPIQGDLWRFQMPIVGVLLLCLVLLATQDERVSRLGAVGSRAGRAVAVGGATLLVAFSLTTLGTVRTELGGRYTYDRREAGRALARFDHDGLTMFVSESGVLPWASGWRSADLLGLNDHHIAVHGATAEYVESLRPDLIQFVVALRDPTQAYRYYHPFSDIVRSGRYEFAAATIKTNSELKPNVFPQAHIYFVRRDAPRTRAAAESLRGLRNVRHLSPGGAARVLRGLGYRG
jgi:hypothetical protein